MPHHSEASVEEILESIKRVIARDAPPVRGARPAAETPEPAGEEEAEDVLDLGVGDVLDEDRCAPGADEEEPPLTTESARHAMRDNLAALAMLAEPGAKPQIVRSGETSLEGLAREMLRPMLAQWLDENLPPMVERLVREEIARIARKED
ncbi:DUF2497 domain-containing protein [Erythrobacter sp. 3-20A1M]|uniref:DUF2497 domain-containing protein n=1 Tax=Erythrobacter sp. 3-20A1M TaxID=2653850 RepID=UPI001BFC5EF2|nr:DUF2497 domain-containing protein [Erythrobacter sp. 3-20A1M]QWC56783.1 DUF2497 domain-containing protein [Erythrobacter sp. 3-20A1M]